MEEGEVRDILEEMGFEVPAPSPRCFFHPKKELEKKTSQAGFNHRRWRSFERLLRLCTRFREAVSRVLCFAKKEFAEMSVSTTHATLPVLQWHESETSLLPLSEKSLQSISMDRWNAYRSQSRIMESQFCGFQWSLVGRHLRSYSIPNDPRLQQDWISSWSMGHEIQSRKSWRFVPYCVHDAPIETQTRDIKEKNRESRIICCSFHYDKTRTFDNVWTLTYGEFTARRNSDSGR